MYRRVLVPLDGSPLAESILRFIEEIAGPLDMEVVLLRVVPLSPEEVMGIAPSVGMDTMVARELTAQRYLKSLVDELWATKGLRARAEVVLGEPAPEIVATARKVDADLIAMTTHGRSGFGRLMFGSVAEAVVRAAPVPVFLMRMVETAVESQAAAGETRS